QGPAGGEGVRGRRRGGAGGRRKDAGRLSQHHPQRGGSHGAGPRHPATGDQAHRRHLRGQHCRQRHGHCRRRPAAPVRAVLLPQTQRDRPGPDPRLHGRPHARRQHCRGEHRGPGNGFPRDPARRRI
ncbi:MAG: hypothetical protein AVDCRST_MAG56-7369, partial [uncultured Cytophagales bacterium]